MRNVDPYKLLWLLPVIFSIHNMEELPLLQTWADVVIPDRRFSLFKDLYKLNNIAFAMILLTFAVTVVIWMEYKKRNVITFRFTFLCTNLLLVNGIMHVAQFLLYKRYVPGLISAVLLMIPYMTYMIFLFARNKRITMKGIIQYSFISMITMSPIIIIFLFVSNLFVKLISGLLAI